MTRLEIITWDWKEQPNWKAVQEALSHFTKPIIMEVDSQSDQYAIVIGPSGLTAQGAQAWFDEHQFDSHQ